MAAIFYISIFIFSSLLCLCIPTWMCWLCRCFLLRPLRERQHIWNVMWSLSMWTVQLALDDMSLHKPSWNVLARLSPSGDGWEVQSGSLFHKIQPWLKTSNTFKGTRSGSVIKKSLQRVIRTLLACENWRWVRPRKKKKTTEKIREVFLSFYFTLSGICCLWLNTVKSSCLNVSYFVQHPIRWADDPLLTKTFIKEVGFFISNPSWFKIHVRPSVQWAETVWQKTEMWRWEPPALCDVRGSFDNEAYWFLAGCFQSETGSVWPTLTWGGL